MERRLGPRTGGPGAAALSGRDGSDPAPSGFYATPSGAWRVDGSASRWTVASLSPQGRFDTGAEGLPRPVVLLRRLAAQRPGNQVPPDSAALEPGEAQQATIERVPDCSSTLLTLPTRNWDAPHVAMDECLNSGYARLETQIEWYDEKSVHNQRCFKRLKLLEVVAAACIPLVATHFPMLAAGLGALVVVLEGIQHLYQFQLGWTSYRSTAEALKHEKYLFLAGAEVYESLEQEAAKRLLASRVESLVSTEHARWVAVRNRKEKSGPGTDTHRQKL